MAEFRRAIEICEGLITKPHASNANSHFLPRLPSVYSELVNLLKAQGREPEAETVNRQAITLYEKLLADLPQGNDKTSLAHMYVHLALLFAGSNRPQEAQQALDKAIELVPNDAEALNLLAWYLTTSPKADLRNPVPAVQLAQRWTELAPQDAMIRNTLGVAQYRAGEWKEAIESLTKAEELTPGRSLAFNGFFLAMAHQQLGSKEKARKWYDRAVEWMEKNKAANEELRRFRAEAAELLGITDESPRKEGDLPKQ